MYSANPGYAPDIFIIVTYSIPGDPVFSSCGSLHSDGECGRALGIFTLGFPLLIAAWFGPSIMMTSVRFLYTEIRTENIFQDLRV